MKQFVTFTERQLDTAHDLVGFCDAVRERRPIERGMVDAIRTVLNWRSLLDEEGRPHEGLFSASMDDVLAAFHRVEAPKGSHRHNSQLSNFEEF